MTGGLDPVTEGVHNFHHVDKDVEDLAYFRYDNHCKGCEENVIEPIDFLQVTDERIPELSFRMCDECGCTLSYKTRQSKTVCSKWLE